MQRVDGPISIGECLRVVGDVVSAGAAQSRTRRVAAPDAAGPVATEGHIENNLIVREKFGDITAACELGEWSAPRSIRAGVATLDVGRNGTTLEEPDADRFVGPLHGIDTTSNIVEPITIGVVLTRGDLASEVVGLVRCVDVTVIGVKRSSEVAIVVDGTAVCRVQCHGIVILRVHTLDDIDLTTVRPARSNHPVRRPGTARVTRHVVEVKDDKTAGVVGCFASQTDTGTSVGLDIGVIDSNVDLPVRVADEAGVPC